MSERQILEQVDKGPGFFIGSMSVPELKIVRQIIRDQYLEHLFAEEPQNALYFDRSPMREYHELVERHQIDHVKLWPKSKRILNFDAFNTVVSLRFFQNIMNELEVSSITSEEGTSWGELYWRIVRPGTSDVGSMHTDRWFRDLGHGVMPPKRRGVKLWIAVETIAGLNGLSVVPNSHKNTDWAYVGEVDHTGISKPRLQSSLDTKDIYHIPASPGDFVIFHDDLIHGGMANRSDQTRVSIEGTLFVPPRT